MAVRRSERDAALDALYAQVPDSNCKGLCGRTWCALPVPMSAYERERVKREGVDIPREQDGQEGSCPALDLVGRCTVYDKRPLICRLWGATENMPCPHGCVPDEGFVPFMVSAAMVQQSIAIGGEQ
jgi:hypothetical protein